MHNQWHEYLANWHILIQFNGISPPPPTINGVEISGIFIIFCSRTKVDIDSGGGGKNYLE